MCERLTVPSDTARDHLLDRLVEGRKQMRWRSETQRDHDRLLYSSAFQRLGGTTQVAASELGRPFHTRLTHTLKVAQVARRSAERLKAKLERGELSGSAARLVECLDVDATESAALAHDLGHPPFGHLAERVLDEKATEKGAGGFEGNAQSFRIVTRLALRGAHPGLDLTRQTLNGMLKYPWLRSKTPAWLPGKKSGKRSRKWGAYGSDEEMFKEVRKYSRRTERSLEACLMDWADDITYAVHDLDDFARAGLIPLDHLARDSRELDRFGERLENELDLGDGDPSSADLIVALREAFSHIDLEGAYEERPGQRVALRSFGSMLITRYIDSVEISETSRPRKAEVEIQYASRLQVEALKQLTMLYVVHRPSLAVLQHGQAEMIADLWDWYFEATEDEGDHRLLPAAYRARLQDDSSPKARARLVTDLIAGMTENSTLEVYRRMSGITSGTLLDAAARAG